MPININEFKQLEVRRKHRITAKLLDFFRENKDKAFSIEDLQKRFDTTWTAMFQRINRLRHEGKIERRTNGFITFYQLKEVVNSTKTESEDKQ